MSVPRLPASRHSASWSLQRLGWVCAGTAIVSGVGTVVVTQTGARTQFGANARALVQKAPPTEYERAVLSYGIIILRTVIGLVLHVFLIQA